MGVCCRAGGGGSFVRVRTLGFAVEYAGIRVRETTTAEETIALVSSKLRLDSSDRARRRIVMVYPLRGDRARRGMARWRVRTLRGEEALLPLRQRASASRRSSQHDGSVALEPLRDEVRFYLHDESSTPLDLFELPKGEDASGSESSDDERAPEARFVGDRAMLPNRDSVTLVGSLLKRSATDPNLWRRRRCVIADDRLFYWRETVIPPLHEPSETRAPVAESAILPKKPSRTSGGKQQGTSNRGVETSANGEPPLVSARDYEIDRVARSRCASIPLASNQATEIVGKRDVPHGIEINTTSKTLVFRAESRAQQLNWLQHLNDAVEIATQNEYITIADHIISDEQSRRVGADLKAAMAEIENDFRIDDADGDSSEYTDALVGLNLDFNDGDLVRKVAQSIMEAEKKFRETAPPCDGDDQYNRNSQDETAPAPSSS